MKEHIYAVIMAGGKGTRFWPLSRSKMPKQLLNITGKKTMIQETIARLHGLIPEERILIVTDKIHCAELKKQLPKIPANNILIEPVGRNTAPCVGLAAIHLIKRDANSIMFILPADHYIPDKSILKNQLLTAAQVAHNHNYLVTIGIPPTHPETGYGYIQVGETPQLVNNNEVYEVKSFREKPNSETAEEFIKAGNFYWNSGMFVWRTSTILANIERFLPDLYLELIRVRVAVGTKNYQNALESAYQKISSISIDYGIMERASQVMLIKGKFLWSDVGSWLALEDIWKKDANGNTVKGKPVVAVQSSNSIVYSPKKIIALVNVDDLVIVDTDDALLICSKDKTQDVKKIVELLENQNLTRLL